MNVYNSKIPIRFVDCCGNCWKINDKQCSSNFSLLWSWSARKDEMATFLLMVPSFFSLYLTHWMDQSVPLVFCFIFDRPSNTLTQELHVLFFQLIHQLQKLIIPGKLVHVDSPTFKIFHLNYTVVAPANTYTHSFRPALITLIVRSLCECMRFNFRRSWLGYWGPSFDVFTSNVWQGVIISPMFTLSSNLDMT